MPDKIEEREAQLVENIVGSVLSSVVKAQGLAASQLVEMIDTIGFEPETAEPVRSPRKPRTFEFDFFRSEVNPATNQIERKRVTASVPLLTLINLPAIAIEEATIEMDLQLVAHERESQEDRIVQGAPGQEALKLYAVPARKQIVRSPERALAVDAAGTIKIRLVMRQQSALGLEKVQSLLDTGSEEKRAPELKASSETKREEEKSALESEPTLPPMPLLKSKPGAKSKPPRAKTKRR